MARAVSVPVPEYRLSLAVRTLAVKAGRVTHPTKNLPSELAVMEFTFRKQAVIALAPL